MRLIHCETLTFKEFVGDSIPPYAILSHTWGDDEVTFKDFRAGPRRTLAGWVKIRGTCRLALNDGIQYAWVDTCCIDKSSSAELTEAINSMFEWYARSQVCYALLSDCSGPLTKSQLQACRWISRGWTLQELIAPQKIEFYNREWAFVGGRASVGDDLCAITGIRRSLMARTSMHDDLPSKLDAIPIGERMSWAAGRSTTRIEDMAYCLLGIFDVNMPLLYGEGSKAFLRLQEEIMKHSNDLSLFAWQTNTDIIRWGEWTNSMRKRRARSYRDSVPHDMPLEPIWGFLATSPDDFASFSDLQLVPESDGNMDYTRTNKGIRIRSILVARDVSSGSTRADADDDVDGAFDPYRVDDCLMIPLNYYSQQIRMRVGIFVKRAGNGVYVRTRPHVLGYIPSEDVTFMMSDLYLATKITEALERSFWSIYSRAIRLPRDRPPELVLTGVQPAHLWNMVSNVFVTRGLMDPMGVAVYHISTQSSTTLRRRTMNHVILCFGLLNGEPWIHLEADSNSTQPVSVQFLVELFAPGTYLNLASRSRQDHSCTVELVDPAAGTVVYRQIRGKIDVGALEGQHVFDVILDWTDTT